MVIIEDARSYFSKDSTYIWVDGCNKDTYARKLWKVLSRHVTSQQKSKLEISEIKNIFWYFSVNEIKFTFIILSYGLYFSK